MIPFLRKKRLSALLQKRLGGYLKYAFGEILLVMIGILLALQVDSWRENWKARHSEQEYLVSFEEDIELQIGRLNNHLEFEEMIFQHSQDILHHYSKEGGFSNLTPIYSKLNDMVTRYTFTKSNTTFSELNASGNLNIISDDALRSQIIAYYQELDRVTLIIANNNTNIIDGVTMPAVFANSVYNRDFLSTKLKELLNVDSLSMAPEVTDKLIRYSEERLREPEKEMQFFNVINFRLTIAKYHVKIFDNYRKDSEALLKSIREHIEE